MKKKYILNEEIRTDKVRIVKEEGSVIVTLKEALLEAEEMNLDLVCLSTDKKPFVCKIMDFNKFKFNEKKREKENKKKNKPIEMKEVKFSLKISENDISYRFKNIHKFLSEGKHVKITISLKGRELYNPENARVFLNKLFKQFSESVIVEKKPSFEGGNYNMVIRLKKGN